MGDDLTSRVKAKAKLPCNKVCAECGQRGPTYINCTVGAFVCARCSGLLRGLNPPHRIKSCALSTFTLGDVELIESNGNDVITASYLGGYDDRCERKCDPIVDKDKFKRFLEEKYERRTWFIPYQKPKMIPKLESKPVSTQQQPSLISTRRPPSRNSSIRSRASTLDNAFSLIQSEETNDSLAGDSGVTADFEVDFENAFGNNNKQTNEHLQQQNTFDLASLNSSLLSDTHNETPNFFDPITPTPPVQSSAFIFNSVQQQAPQYQNPYYTYQTQQTSMAQPQPPPQQVDDRYRALAELDSEVKQAKSNKLQRQVSTGQAIFGAAPSAANPFLTKQASTTVVPTQNPFGTNPFL